ncbi:hypothetical protein NHX12_007959, partial [Muraenolepis orangiensis]
MAEAAQPPTMVDIDPDFEPLSRPRSCTWPLPRPEFTSPGGGGGGADSDAPSPVPPSGRPEPAGLSLLEESEDFSEEHDASILLCCTDFQNAWGNMSYADLITKAIESSPESRLTLSQIYDWMVKSVPYFKDKGDSNSSAGWKNSIRHNLSLHSRFVRVQNEGTGKSSWWMLNPEGGKSGKSPRRRAASMDNNSKFSKSRGRAAKKKLSLQGGPEGGSESPGSAYSKWPGSPNSHSNDDFDAWNSFRPRTSSNASTLSGRLSPFMPEDDLVHEGDVHMVYPGAPGSKMAATLPSLTEIAGSLGHGSENVMENLLDNLNLLSPNNPQVGGGAGTPGSSQSSQSSPLMQGSPGPMQTLAEAKPGFGVPPLGGRCMLPSYSSVQRAAKHLVVGGNGLPHGLPHGHPHGVLNQAPMNGGRLLMSLNHGGVSARLPPLKGPMQMPYGQLPSDLDDMSIERFECDMESILHDTLMDGDSLDFNFEPMVTQPGFTHGVKSTTH